VAAVSPPFSFLALFPLSSSLKSRKGERAEKTRRAPAICSCAITPKNSGKTGENMGDTVQGESGWFFPNCNREEAEAELKSAVESRAVPVFLVRPSRQAGSLALSSFAPGADRVKHYIVSQAPQGWIFQGIDGNSTSFATVRELVRNVPETRGFLGVGEEAPSSVQFVQSGFIPYDSSPAHEPTLYVFRLIFPQRFLVPLLR
jgi:SH2 domain